MTGLEESLSREIATHPTIRGPGPDQESETKPQAKLSQSFRLARLVSVDSGASIAWG